MTIAKTCALIKSDSLDAYLTRLGNGAKFARYNGTMPATTLAALAGNTLLETFIWTGVPVGTSNGTSIDINETAGMAGCVNTNNVAGTATWGQWETSAGYVVLRVEMGVDGFASSNAVVNGTTTTLTGLTIVAA